MNIEYNKDTQVLLPNVPRNLVKISGAAGFFNFKYNNDMRAQNGEAPVPKDAELPSNQQFATVFIKPSWVKPIEGKRSYVNIIMPRMKSNGYDEYTMDYVYVNHETGSAGKGTLTTTELKAEFNKSRRKVNTNREAGIDGYTPSSRPSGKSLSDVVSDVKSIGTSVSASSGNKSRCVEVFSEEDDYDDEFLF